MKRVQVKRVAVGMVRTPVPAKSEQLSEQQGGAASHQCKHHTEIGNFKDQQANQCRKADTQAAFARAKGAGRRL